MKYYAFKSKYKENKYPIYVISNDDPTEQSDWNHKSYDRIFLGCFSTYNEALNSIQEEESDFAQWEKLDDSYLQGETVFVFQDSF